MIILMKIKLYIIKTGYIFQIHKDPYEDPYWSKYQCLINKKEGVGIKHFNDPKAFIDYLNDMHDVYKNIGD